MIITKITESKFELDFDASETQILADAKAVLEAEPENIIERTIDQAMRELEIGTSSLVGRIVDQVQQRRSR